jgi:hypothetical protein
MAVTIQSTASRTTNSSAFHPSSELLGYFQSSATGGLRGLTLCVKVRGMKPYPATQPLKKPTRITSEHDPQIEGVAFDRGETTPDQPFRLAAVEQGLNARSHLRRETV